MHRVDLNLFRVFEAILHHRSVSAASKELGVTPSAVSHALGRLRQSLDDELFIYGEAGMAPTPRAIELAPAIRDGLERIDAALRTRPFAPAHSTRVFRISATDYSTLVLLTPLIAHLARVAPQLELRIFPYNRLDVVRHLDEGRLDLVIGWFNEVPERMRRAELLREREALAVRPGHPLLAGPLTKQDLFAYPFVVVELTGSEEQGEDGFMDDRGVWRRVWIDRLMIETSGDGDAVGHVAVSLPHFAAVPEIVASTDMVATLPARLARRAADRGLLALLEVPYEPLTVPLDALWHHRGDADGGLQWLIGEMIAIARTC